MSTTFDMSTLRPLYVSPILLIVGYLLYSFVSRDKRRKHMPPLVPGPPLLNHTLIHLEPEFPWKLVKWAQDYGPIYRTKSAATDFIWLGSPMAIKDIIDRRSAIYSSRQPLPMSSDVASGGRRLTLMPKGNKWRTIRTIIHRMLTPQMARFYEPIQTFEAKQLSVNILDKPDDFYMHNRRYSTSVILQFVYGRRAPIWDCEEIRMVFEVLGRFTKYRRPGSYVVDTYPTLASNPVFNLFSNWKSEGAEIHKADTAVFMKFLNRMKKDVESGKATHCFGREFLQSNYEEHGLDDLDAAYTLGAMIEAGSETTTMMLNTLYIAVLSNPETLVKAHEELDRVIGSNRAPTFDDEPKLRYIRAMVKEMLRWRPINKFGQNHYATQDDWYGDYFIPKGAVMMINWWAVHYDPERYPNPHLFNPDRFLDFPLSAGEEANQTDPLKRPHVAFGGGRRICPGQHVAEKSIFLNYARILWGFDVDFKKDKDGNKIPVDFGLLGTTPGMFSNPKPFQCELRVRSAKHEKVIREDWSEAQKCGIDFTTAPFDKVMPSKART